MKKDYSKVRSFAVKMLDKYGRDMRFTLPSLKRGTYNPATSANSGIADIVVDGVGVMLDYTISEKRNSSILESDKKIIFANNSGTALQNGMVCTIDGIEYLVVDPGTMQPADDVIVNFAQVRA